MQNNTYGSFIKERRKQLNITQAELAKKLNCTSQAISKYENDKASIYIGLLVPLCQILQLDIESFICQKYEKNNDLADSNDFNPAILSQSLCYLREKGKKTQNQVAKELNIPQQKLSKWENNQSTPNIDELQTLAQYYKLSIISLYFGSVGEPSITNPESIKQKDEPNKEKKHKILFISLFTIIAIILVVITLLISLIFKNNNKTQVDSSYNPPIIESFTLEENK